MLSPLFHAKFLIIIKCKRGNSFKRLIIKINTIDKAIIMVINSASKSLGKINSRLAFQSL